MPPPDHPSSEGIFSNIQSKPPVVQLPRFWTVRRGSHPEPALHARLSSTGCPARAARHKVSVLTHSGMETSLLQGDPRSSASSSTEFIPPRPTKPALRARRRSALNLPLVLSRKYPRNMGWMRIPTQANILCPVQRQPLPQLDAAGKLESFSRSEFLRKKFHPAPSSSLPPKASAHPHPSAQVWHTQKSGRKLVESGCSTASARSPNHFQGWEQDPSCGWSIP